MSTNHTYLLDANVFIEAKRRYYGFDLCPGFWDCLEHHGKGEVLLSIDRVKQELKGEDELQDWVKNIGQGIFMSTRGTDVIACYDEIVNWVNDQNQFHAAAVAGFADIADGWLVAYAKAMSCTLVTHEVRAPDAKKRVPIPNVCLAFDVDYVDTFDMLRALKTRFHWSAAS